MNEQKTTRLETMQEQGVPVVDMNLEYSGEPPEVTIVYSHDPTRVGKSGQLAITVLTAPNETRIGSWQMRIRVRR